MPLVLDLAERMAARRRPRASGRRRAGDGHAGTRRSASTASRFAYPGHRPRSSSTASTSPSPPVARSPSSARTVPARRRWPSCCAGFYDPTAGAIRVDGVDLRDLDLASWRSRVAAVFQDFVRYELTPARQRRARRRRRRRRRRRPRSPTPAPSTSPTSTRRWRRPTRAAPTCRAGSGSASPWRGRWPPCGSAPASCSSTSRPRSSTCAARPRCSSGCSPPREGCTTVLISHRFSTVRLADLICVVEHGRVVELGTHDELMARRRSLPHDVRAPGVALRRSRRRRGRRAGDARRELRRTNVDDPDLPRRGAVAAAVDAARLPGRAAAARHLVRADVAVVAARRLRRAVAEGARRRRRVRRRRRASAGAAAGLAAAAAAGWLLRTLGSRVEMRFRDRATIELEAHVAHLQAVVPDARAPRAARSTSTACSCCASTSSCSTTSTCRCSAPSARPGGCVVTVVLLVSGATRRSSCSPSSRCRRSCSRRGGRRSSARPRRAPPSTSRLARHLFELVDGGRAGEGAARASASPTPMADRRRAAWQRWYDAVAGAEVGQRRLVRGRVARCSGSPTSPPSCGWPPASTRPPATCSSCSPPAPTCRATSASPSATPSSCAGPSTRRSGSCGSRTSPTRTPTAAELPVPERLDDGIRFEHVSFAYPGTDRARARRRRPRAAGRLGRRPRRRERRRQDDAREAAVPLLRPDVGPHHRRRRRPRRASRRPGGASGCRARSRTSSASSTSPAAAIGLGDLDRVEEREPVLAAVGRAGADDVVERLPDGIDTQLGASWHDGVELSIGQWQKLALARGLHARPAARVRPRRADRRPRRRDRARAVRALRRRVTGGAATTAGSPCSCRTASRRCAWPTSSSSSTAPRSSSSGTHDELVAAGGLYAELYEIQARAYR